MRPLQFMESRGGFLLLAMLPGIVAPFSQSRDGIAFEPDGSRLVTDTGGEMMGSGEQAHEWRKGRRAGRRRNRSAYTFEHGCFYPLRRSIRDLKLDA